MSLDFTYGKPVSPRGHALVYFSDVQEQNYYASYIVLLPVTVDVAKYVPPFLMNQVGELGPGDMSAFAFPPAPMAPGVEHPPGEETRASREPTCQTPSLVNAAARTAVDVSSRILKLTEWMGRWRYKRATC